MRLIAATFASLLQLSCGNFDRFCGVAVIEEQSNGFSAGHLEQAANEVGASHIWHYNWLMTTDVRVPGVQFVPMIKEPGQTQGRSVNDLPQADADGVGTIVKGWNEPDDAGQAGRDEALRTDPGSFADEWTRDMLVAQSKGYTEFVGPAIAHDVCWLDHFLQACETTEGCKDLVTYLAPHRYRNDCATYEAEPDYMGWRDDLSYILTFYRLMEKYNQRGFQIRGLVWDEFGCLDQDFSAPAPVTDQQRYMTKWYAETVVPVLLGDSVIIEKIHGTGWIGHSGPDAGEGAYVPGTCQWQGDGGAEAAADAVRAIQSIRSMAWFSIHPNLNYLFGEEQLTGLGERYFEACAAAIPAAAAPNNNAPTPDSAAPTLDPDMSDPDTSTPDSDAPTPVPDTSTADGDAPTPDTDASTADDDGPTPLGDEPVVDATSATNRSVASAAAGVVSMAFALPTHAVALAVVALSHACLS